LKRSGAVRTRLHTDAQLAQGVDRIPQLYFAGCIADHNPGTLLLQKGGGGKSGATEADNDYFFILKVHY
jgi:hypothetical protein